jgi:uncharacterized protein DUF4159
MAWREPPHKRRRRGPNIEGILCNASAAACGFAARMIARLPWPGAVRRTVRRMLTGGSDPRFRIATTWAVSVHVLAIFLPLLIHSCSRQDGYEIPGGGDPIAQLVKIKKIKPKKEKLFVLNMNSPFIFWVPKIDDSDIMEQVDDQTKDVYNPADLTRKQKDGIKGRWPGMGKNAKVRFIRLKYAGGDWDQDMGASADSLMLKQFALLTGLKVADTTEAIPISALRRYPKHKAPPFVYITGSRGMRLTSSEVKDLRRYCIEEGGMLFADNGGGSRWSGFDPSFRRAMKLVFPNLSWVDIANDDVIYRQPYQFPSGAPPLWHHSGNRAVGLKHNGRWVAFYHQGDINDAWKEGHSGLTADRAKPAYQLAVNVIYYSFCQYAAKHSRK